MTTTGLSLVHTVELLKKIPKEINEYIIDMSKEMSGQDIASAFNQEVMDLFVTLERCTREHNVQKSCNISGNRAMFDAILAVNRNAPIDRFSTVVLEHAPRIFAKDEDYFYHLDISELDKFNVIRADVFRDLSHKMNPIDKSLIFDHFSMLTTYTCAYVYKSLL